VCLPDLRTDKQKAAAVPSCNGREMQKTRLDGSGRASCMRLATLFDSILRDWRVFGQSLFDLFSEPVLVANGPFFILPERSAV
jgi:hypothetical protein